MPKAKAVKIGDVHLIDDEQPSEETELVSFLDNLGPSGVSECSLYRITPQGKQKFVTAGPPSQFTELFVQQQYGGGDYLIRAKLNSKWFRSKGFSVEGPAINTHVGGDGGSELERIRADLEAQRLRLQEQSVQMETERRDREQRNHELQLALIQNRGESSQSQIADMINGLKSLHDMSGTQEQSLTTLERSLGIIARITEIRAGTTGGDGGGWLDWLKPVAGEVGKALIPRVLPFIAPAAAAPPAPPAPAPAAPAPPVPPAMTPGLPEVRMESEEKPAADPIEPAPPSGDPEKDFLIMKAQALAYIIPLARMNRDPEFYAALAVEQVETTSNPVIARFLTEIQTAESFAEWFKQLQAIESTIITSQRWFEVFFQSVRDVLTSKEEESPEA